LGINSRYEFQVGFLGKTNVTSRLIFVDPRKTKECTHFVPRSTLMVFVVGEITKWQSRKPTQPSHQLMNSEYFSMGSLSSISIHSLVLRWKYNFTHNLMVQPRSLPCGCTTQRQWRNWPELACKTYLMTGLFHHKPNSSTNQCLH